MADYRLEACTACGAVRLVLAPLLTMQRMRDGTDRPEYVGGATIWRVDSCQPCQRAYEKHMEELSRG